MGISMGKVDLEEMTLEKVKEFFEWLQGKSCPDNLHFDTKFSLTEEEAFSIIYYLQEGLEILPDKFEMCKECKDIYDSYEEGTHIDEESEGQEGEKFNEAEYGNYCYSCIPY